MIDKVRLSWISDRPARLRERWIYRCFARANPLLRPSIRVLDRTMWVLTASALRELLPLEEDLSYGKVLRELRQDAAKLLLDKSETASSVLDKIESKVRIDAELVGTSFKPRVMWNVLTCWVGFLLGFDPAKEHAERPRDAEWSAWALLHPNTAALAKFAGVWKSHLKEMWEEWEPYYWPCDASKVMISHKWFDPASEPDPLNTAGTFSEPVKVEVSDYDTVLTPAFEDGAIIMDDLKKWLESPVVRRYFAEKLEETRRPIYISVRDFLGGCQHRTIEPNKKPSFAGPLNRTEDSDFLCQYGSKIGDGRHP